MSEHIIDLLFYVSLVLWVVSVEVRIWSSEKKK